MSGDSMVSAREIYYFNSLLGEQKVYGVDEINNLIENLNSEKSIPESLIEKKLLDEGEFINENSLELIQNLEEYNKSNSYLTINSLLISLNKENNCIVLNKINNNDFSLKKSLKKIIIVSLMKDYPFLCKNRESSSSRCKADLGYIIVDKIIQKDDNQWFYIKKEKYDKLTYFAIYFEDQDAVFKYDLLTEDLREVNPQDLRVELGKIFELE
ncbi:DUF5081 family protein [Clostridium manihotivorum]|nr:DUF5081 family protein [Clostridium manihotivorum]